jgi:protein-arginine kinase activator protein McsA
MIEINNITYFLYLLDFLEDNNYKNLIQFLYEKKEFFNPYKTFKELFLALLFNSEYVVHKYFSPEYLSLDDIIDGEAYYHNTGKIDIVDADYFKLLEAFKNKDYMLYKNNKFFIGDERLKLINKDHDFETMLELYNSIFLSSPNYKLVDKEYLILKIIKSLQSFHVELPKRNKHIFKKIINTAVETAIANEYCYILSPINMTSANIPYSQWHLKITYFNELKNDEVYIILQNENKLYLAEPIYESGINSNYLNIVEDADFSQYVNRIEIKQYTAMNNDSSNHSLLGAKTNESYKNSIKSIDDAIHKLKEKIAERENCHICNPIFKNTTKNKKQMCGKCEQLFDLLLAENLDNVNQQKIVYAIKKKEQDLKEYSNINDIRTIRRNNLENYLIKLNNQYKIKNKKRIEYAVNNIFKGYNKFYFPK